MLSGDSTIVAHRSGGVAIVPSLAEGRGRGEEAAEVREEGRLWSGIKIPRGAIIRRGDEGERREGEDGGMTDPYLNMGEERKGGVGSTTWTTWTA